MGTESFALVHIACTGQEIEQTEMLVSKLSAKWIDVGTDLLSGGPIFTQDLDGLLDGYQIKCTAGICHLSIASALAFSAIMLPHGSELQNVQLLSVFNAQLASLTAESEAMVLQRRLASVTQRPACLAIDWLNASISEENCEAVFQLVYHFAASYFLWRDGT